MLDLLGCHLLVAGLVEEQRLGPTAGCEQIQQRLVGSLDCETRLLSRLYVQINLGYFVSTHWLL